MKFSMRVLGYKGTFVGPGEEQFFGLYAKREYFDAPSLEKAVETVKHEWNIKGSEQGRIRFRKEPFSDTHIGVDKIKVKPFGRQFRTWTNCYDFYHR